jgi:hypothetical protein
VDLHHSDADPDPTCTYDADPDSAFHFDADPEPDPSFQIKSQNFEKVLKQAHIPFILACHLQIDAVPDPDPVHQYDADPDPKHWLRGYKQSLLTSSSN